MFRIRRMHRLPTSPRLPASAGRLSLLQLLCMAPSASLHSIGKFTLESMVQICTLYATPQGGSVALQVVARTCIESEPDLPCDVLESSGGNPGPEATACKAMYRFAEH